MITGNDVFDKIIGLNDAVLLFGSAGSGKTTLLLDIARNTCRDPRDKCLYISTEETLHYDRIARAPSRYENVLFTEYYDFRELLDFTLYTLPFTNVRRVFVDSINSLYRVIAYEENSIELFGLMLAVLWKSTIDRGGSLYGSAQVRIGFDDEEEEILASGMNILDYWFDVIIHMGWRDGRRYARIVKPEKYSDRGSYFLITGDGIVWLRD